MLSIQITPLHCFHQASPSLARVLLVRQRVGSFTAAWIASLKAQSPRQGTVWLRGRGQYLNINHRMKNSFVFKEEKIRGRDKK
jgi:hypothetical protein